MASPVPQRSSSSSDLRGSSPSAAKPAAKPASSPSLIPRAAASTGQSPRNSPRPPPLSLQTDYCGTAIARGTTPFSRPRPPSRATTPDGRVSPLVRRTPGAPPRSRIPTPPGAYGTLRTAGNNAEVPPPSGNDTRMSAGGDQGGQPWESGSEAEEILNKAFRLHDPNGLGTIQINDMADFFHTLEDMIYGREKGRHRVLTEPNEKKLKADCEEISSVPEGGMDKDALENYALHAFRKSLKDVIAAALKNAQTSDVPIIVPEGLKSNPSSPQSRSVDALGRPRSPRAAKATLRAEQPKTPSKPSKNTEKTPYSPTLPVGRSEFGFSPVASSTPKTPLRGPAIDIGLSPRSPFGGGVPSIEFDKILADDEHPLVLQQPDPAAHLAGELSSSQPLVPLPKNVDAMDDLSRENVYDLIVDYHQLLKARSLYQKLLSRLFVGCANEVTKLSTQMKADAQTIMEYETEIKKLKAEREEVNAGLSKQRAEKSQLQANIETLENEVARAQGFVEGAEDALDTQQKRHTDLSKKYKELQDDYKRAERGREAAQADAQAKSRTLSQKESHIKTLESNLSATHDKTVSLQEEINKLMQEKRQVEDESMHLKESLRDMSDLYDSDRDHARRPRESIHGAPEDLSEIEQLMQSPSPGGQPFFVMEDAAREASKTASKAASIAAEFKIGPGKDDDEGENEYESDEPGFRIKSSDPSLQGMVRQMGELQKKEQAQEALAAKFPCETICIMHEAEDLPPLSTMLPLIKITDSNRFRINFRVRDHILTNLAVVEESSVPEDSVWDAKIDNYKQLLSDKVRHTSPMDFGVFDPGMGDVEPTGPSPAWKTTGQRPIEATPSGIKQWDKRKPSKYVEPPKRIILPAEPTSSSNKPLRTGVQEPSNTSKRTNRGAPKKDTTGPSAGPARRKQGPQPATPPPARSHQIGNPSTRTRSLRGGSNGGNHGDENPDGEDEDDGSDSEPDRGDPPAPDQFGSRPLRSPRSDLLPPRTSVYTEVIACNLGERAKLRELLKAQRLSMEDVAFVDDLIHRNSRGPPQCELLSTLCRLQHKVEAAIRRHKSDGFMLQVHRASGLTQSTMSVLNVPMMPSPFAMFNWPWNMLWHMFWRLDGADYDAAATREAQAREREVQQHRVDRQLVELRREEVELKKTLSDLYAERQRWIRDNPQAARRLRPEERVAQMATQQAEEAERMRQAALTPAQRAREQAQRDKVKADAAAAAQPRSGPSGADKGKRRAKSDPTGTDPKSRPLRGGALDGTESDGEWQRPVLRGGANVPDSDGKRQYPAPTSFWQDDRDTQAGPSRAGPSRAGPAARGTRGTQARPRDAQTGSSATQPSPTGRVLRDGTVVGERASSLPIDQAACRIVYSDDPLPIEEAPGYVPARGNGSDGHGSGGRGSGGGGSGGGGSGGGSSSGSSSGTGSGGNAGTDPLRLPSPARSIQDISVNIDVAARSLQGNGETQASLLGSQALGGVRGVPGPTVPPGRAADILRAGPKPSAAWSMLTYLLLVALLYLLAQNLVMHAQLTSAQAEYEAANGSGAEWAYGAGYRAVHPLYGGGDGDAWRFNALLEEWAEEFSEWLPHTWAARAAIGAAARAPYGRAPVAAADGLGALGFLAALWGCGVIGSARRRRSGAAAGARVGAVRG